MDLSKYIKSKKIHVTMIAFCLILLVASIILGNYFAAFSFVLSIVFKEISYLLAKRGL